MLLHHLPSEQAMPWAAGLPPDPGWEEAHCHGEQTIPGMALAFRGEWGLSGWDQQANCFCLPPPSVAESQKILQAHDKSPAAFKCLSLNSILLPSLSQDLLKEESLLMTKGNLKGCHRLFDFAPLCRLGVYLLKSILKCPLGRLHYHEHTPAFGVVCLQERTQPLVPAKDSLSLEGLGFGANGRKGAVGTVRHAQTSLDPTTIPQEVVWSTVVNESWALLCQVLAMPPLNQYGMRRSVEPCDIC